MNTMMRTKSGSKKKGLILLRTWVRDCMNVRKMRMISWKNNNRVAPEGCFWVYVGQEKRRFCIKTQCLNHPLFKMLLEEAESEYGFAIDGPLELPCQVDFFVKVLLQISFNSSAPPPHHDDDDHSIEFPPSLGCTSFPCTSSAHNSYQRLPYPRLLQLAFHKINYY